MDLTEGLRAAILTVLRRFRAGVTYTVRNGVRMTGGGDFTTARILRELKRMEAEGLVERAAAARGGALVRFDVDAEEGLATFG